MHCIVGQGCKIYEIRPGTCRKFECAYITSPQVGECWRPRDCHMFIAHHPAANRIVIHVDRAHPDIWKQEPYYGDIQRMAAAVYPKNGQVLILDGRNAVAVLPDRHKELGAYSDDKIIVTTQSAGPQGPVYDVFLFTEGDPVLLALRKQAGAVVDRTTPAK